MANRQAILGDNGKSAPEHWDPVWLKPIHILISLNGPGDGLGQSQALEMEYQALVKLAEPFKTGVECLNGHRGPNGQLLDYQTASVLYDQNNIPTAKEHFGFDDGISNPFFKGTGAHPNSVIGGGKVTGKDPKTMEGWEPLETGEFILGYKDEAFECPEAPMPPLLGRNGTYMVFRKLHQNVGSFETYIKDLAAQLGEDEELLKAKFVGRWPNGAPLATFPTKESADDFEKRYKAAQDRLRTEPDNKAALAQYAAIRNDLVAFDYDHDLAGARCPIGSHTRRANPRGSLEYGRTGTFDTHGALSDRRRILRRGLPYGSSKDRSDDSGEHGSIIMMICANINRQFEFVQQQWMNYGNDFKLGNDKDPIIGNQDTDEHGGVGRMLIMSEPDSGKRPLLCGGIPRFVETRGGGYFFIPSLTALRMIGEGTIDPT
jgi:Dyp-type peroxidase family